MTANQLIYLVVRILASSSWSVKVNIGWTWAKHMYLFMFKHLNTCLDMCLSSQVDLLRRRAPLYFVDIPCLMLCLPKPPPSWEGLNLPSWIVTQYMKRATKNEQNVDHSHKVAPSPHLPQSSILSNYPKLKHVLLPPKFLPKPYCCTAISYWLTSNDGSTSSKPQQQMAFLLSKAT